MNHDEYRIDSHKLMNHPQRVSQWLEAGNDWEKAKKVYPIYLEISPSGGCNHRCTFCAMDYIGYKPRTLDIEVMERVIPEMAEFGVKSIMFAGEGEPLLYSDMGKLANLTVESGIDIAFTTNGVLLTIKLIEKLIPITTWMKVSIDAGIPETYASIHNTKESDYGRVINNLKYAIEFRNNKRLSCTIGAQMILLPENADEVQGLAKICRDEIGMDYLVVKPYSQHMFSKTRKYENLEYEPLVEKANEAQSLSNSSFKVICRTETIKKHIDRQYGFKVCNAVPFFWAHVMSNHDVYVCSAYLHNKTFFLGNLLKNSFQELWEGDCRKMVFSIMRDTFNIEECRLNCRMNAVNEYLWNLNSPYPHVNFI